MKNRALEQEISVFFHFLHFCALAMEISNGEKKGIKHFLLKNRRIYTIIPMSLNTIQV